MQLPALPYPGPGDPAKAVIREAKFTKFTLWSVFVTAYVGALEQRRIERGPSSAHATVAQL